MFYRLKIPAWCNVDAMAEVVHTMQGINFRFSGILTGDRIFFSIIDSFRTGFSTA